MALSAFYKESEQAIIVDKSTATHDGYRILGLIPVSANLFNLWPWDSIRSNIKKFTWLPTANEKIGSAFKMFDNCKNLTSLDLSHFDTSSITNMYNMFNQCSSLESIDLSSFDTSSVVSMNNMFSACTSLTQLDLSPLDTSSVSTMGYMFSACTNLQSIDLSPLKTSSVTDMGYMFNACQSLTYIDVSPLDTSSVFNMSGMFAFCSNLKSLDLSNFNTCSVTNMNEMFKYCTNITDINLSSFDTSLVKSMNSMFKGCKNLKRLDLSNFNTKSLTNISYMLNECDSLRSLDISSLDTTNVKNKVSVFNSDLNIIDISGNMSNILDQLPNNQYYSVYDGSLVDKINLKEGTWVKDKVYIESLASIVHVRQGLRDRKKYINAQFKHIGNAQLTLNAFSGIKDYASGGAISTLGNGTSSYILTFAAMQHPQITAGKWIEIEFEAQWKSGYKAINTPKNYFTYRVSPYMGIVGTINQTVDNLIVMPFKATFSAGYFRGTTLVYARSGVQTTVPLSFDAIIY